MNRTMTALGTSISRRQLVGGMMAAAVAAPIVACRTRGVAFAEASEIKDGTYSYPNNRIYNFGINITF